MERNRLKKNVLKLTFDNLPNGICFFSEKGIPVLCNLTMQRLMFALTGRDIQTLNELKYTMEHLTEMGAIKREDDMVILPNGEVWRIIFTEVEDTEKRRYIQAAASDVTELYARKKELEESNKKLIEDGKRLKKMYENILTVTYEEEALNMKMKR